MFAATALILLFSALFGTAAANAAPQPYPTAPTSSGVAASSTSRGVEPTVTSNPGADGNGGTASTGVAVIGISVIGLVLIVGGVVLVFGGRSRRAHS